MIWLRLAAWAIAIAAVVDPGFEDRAEPPVVVGLNVAAARPSPAIEQLVQRLSDRLTRLAVLAREPALSEGPWCVDVDVCLVVTDGTTVVGGRPMRAVNVIHLASPATTQLIAARAPAGELTAVNEVRLALAGGQPGDVVDVVVEDDGIEVGRLTHTRTAAAIDADVVVPWWPRRGGARSLAVHLVGAAGDGPTAVLADTSPAPLDVLVWEGRPSWTGTFVRRALQDDPRLVVRAASQIAPRRVVRRGLPGPPGEDDLRRARAVVVSGAAALDAAAISWLERYARSGGAVVVALDDRPAGALQALMPGPVAARRRVADPVAIGGALRSGELVTFSRGPGDAVLASWDDAPPDQRAVVVERRTGRGMVIVSGALDAWRWRDDTGGFERFWRDTVVRAARASSPPLAAAWQPAPSGPRLEITSRVGIATGTWPALTLTRECGGSANAIVAVEAAAPGTWLAEPLGLAAGCTVTVASGAEHITTAWPGAATLPASAPEAGALEALATVTGGAAIEGDRDQVEAAVGALIAAALRRPPVPTTWHPARAWWWFIPFVGLLGAEWWQRRRRGRA